MPRAPVPSGKHDAVCGERANVHISNCVVIGGARGLVIDGPIGANVDGLVIRHVSPGIEISRGGTLKGRRVIHDP
jgi:hypothetical protein